MLWRFMQISDMHLASDMDGTWNNRFLCSMMPEVMLCLKHDLHMLNPDFLLLTGDIVSKQTKEAMYIARDMVNMLELPYYPMGGNHDFVLPESRKWFIDAFQHHLPRPSTYYSFTHKGLHFCILDAWWKWQDGTLAPISEAAVAAELDKTVENVKWCLPPHQFDWLQDDLENHKDLPTVISLHYPVLPIPSRMCRPGFKNGGYLDNGGLLMHTLQRYPQVKAIFAGHVHMHYVEQKNGITQIVTGALPEFPVEYREVRVHADKLEVYTLGLSDPSFSQRSLIAGKDWTAGEAQDRCTIISLL